MSYQYRGYNAVVYGSHGKVKRINDGGKAKRRVMRVGCVSTAVEHVLNVTRKWDTIERGVYATCLLGRSERKVGRPIDPERSYLLHLCRTSGLSARHAEMRERRHWWDERDEHEPATPGASRTEPCVIAAPLSESNSDRRGGWLQRGSTHAQHGLCIVEQGRSSWGSLEAAERA